MCIRPRTSGGRRSSLKACWAFVLLSCACANRPHDSAGALFRAAEWEQRHGNLQVALKKAERGLETCRGQPDSELCWKFRLLEAELRLNFPPDPQVLEELERANSSGAPTPELRASLLAELGYSRFLLDQSDQSLRSARAILEEARQIASAPLASRALPLVEIMYGTVLRDDLAKAEAMLSSALRHAQRQQDPFLIAQALTRRGFVLMSHARFDEAVPWLSRARQVAESSNNQQGRELALGNLGWCYYGLGDFDQALDAFAQARSLSAKIGDADTEHRWLGDIGDIHFTRGELTEAVPYFRQAADLAKQVGNYSWLALWLSNLATSTLALGELDSAERLNQEALDLYRAHPNPSFEVWPALNSAEIAARRKQFPEAEKLYSRVIALARAHDEPQELWEAQAGLASVYRGTGRPVAAEREYQETIASIVRAWSDLTQDDSKLTFLEEDMVRFYKDFVDFLVERGETQRALQVAESSRARLLAEKLGGRASGELQLGKLRRAAQDLHAVFLSYWLAPSRSFLWVIDSKCVTLLKLPPAQDLERAVERHNRRILDGEDPLNGFSGDATYLYRTLLGPARQAIPPGSKVIIVPDGHLNELSFETLIVDDPQPHYWIEDATVAIAPSLGVIEMSHIRQSGQRKLLLIGDPVPPRGAVPRLPHVKDEVDIVAREFSPAARTVFTGERAYPAAYRESRPAGFSLIHFAAHAVPRAERPLHSEIILSEKDHAYKLYARDIRQEPIRADLVTISGCHSAGSRTYAGEGLVGFAWAFLSAGAGNVIAGLWDVDDSTAPKAMGQLYAHLLAGENPVDALRHVKLELLRSGRLYRRPYFWAPLVAFTRSVP